MSENTRSARNKKTSNQGKRTSEALIICFLVAATVALLCVGRPRFYGADDIQFEELMGGFVTGKPEPHVYYILYPLSWMLTGLYSLLPGFPWYATFLLTVHLAVLVILLHIVYSISGHIITPVLAWAIFIAIDLTHMLNLEWTTTAGVAAVAAMLLTATISNDNTVKEKGKRGIIVLMLLISFNLRVQSMLLSLPALVVVYIVRCSRMGIFVKGCREVRTTVTLPAVTVVLCLFCMAVHCLAYSDANWRAYAEYTDERSKLVDYTAMPNYDTSQNLYESAGISSARYDLIYDQNYMFGFEGYDVERLHIVTEYMEQSRGMGLRDALGQALTAIYSKQYLAADLCILALIAWIMLKERYISANLACVGLVAFLLAAWTGLIMMGRMIYRVEACLLIVVVGGLAGTLVSVLPNNEEISTFPDSSINGVLSLIRIGALSLLTTIILLYSGLQVFENSVQTNRLCDDAMKISEYETSHPQLVILRDFWSFVGDYQPAFDAHECKDGSNAQWMGGWFYGTPNQQKALANIGIKSPSEALLLRDNVVVAVSDMRTNPEGVCSRLADYLSDYYDCEVSYRLRDSLRTSVGSVRYYSFSCAGDR